MSLKSEKKTTGDFEMKHIKQKQVIVRKAYKRLMVFKRLHGLEILK